MKKIVVLSGSVREGRKSHYVSKVITTELKRLIGYEVTLLDLKEYTFPVLEFRMDSGNELPQGLEQFCSILEQADGIIIVSPEYKNGIPGSLKNILDYLPPQLFRHIPIGIVTVSSGGFGGINCLSQLRLVSFAIGGIPIPEKLCVSNVNDVFYTSGDLKDESFSNKAVQFIDAFLWYVQRLSVHPIDATAIKV